MNIFRKVVRNILLSVEKDRRTADLILYYPIREYTDLLEDDTPFALINEIMVPGATDPKDRFMIWRLREGAHDTGWRS